MKQSYSQVSMPGKLAGVIVFLLLAFPFSLRAQQEEILLTFRHPAVGHIYVGSIYDYQTQMTYLPVVELFSRFEILYEPDVRNFTVRGNFITPNNPYSINLSSMQVQLGKNILSINPEDFRIGEIDYYLAPRIFEEIFGLNFTVNINHLALQLETTHTLPVQERLARERARSQMESRELIREDYPMAFNRKRSFLSGTMLDYSLTADYLKDIQSFGYTVTGGMEVLGGDIQGTVYGTNSSLGYHNLSTSGLRWRYAIRNSNLLSGIMAGQLSSSGLQPVSYRGIALTNDPIEPRRMYETFVLDGTTEPDSEVEIYVNERLTDYKRADELGYYRFDVPVTYGTTRLQLRIYTPSGELIITDRQMQVPFTFLPRGVFSYNIQAGQAESYVSETNPEPWVAHTNVAYGLTRWLTASAGAQHLGNEFIADDLLYYSTVSARVAKQYLLNFDAAPGHFYRAGGSVMYTNNLSINFNYTSFDGESMFNARGAKEHITANVYLPFSLFGLNTGLRLGGDHIVLENNSLTSFRTDFSARLGKVNLRFNYRDNFITSSEATTFGQGVLTSALTYTISRSPGVPVYVRGMYVRMQNQFNIRSNELLVSELQLSRTVMKTGRLNIGLSYNHLARIINTQLGFTLDLNKVRSATSVNTSGERVNARQRLNGSVGWDMPNRWLVLNNRQQVGQSAASVLLYVDENSNGKYDAGEQRLPFRGVKLDRTAPMAVGRDSVLRISQLQSYYLYNLSINRNAIADPTLVPNITEFSFIADPNQYKRIEVPFYRGGIIEGTVLIQRDERQYGQGGLRLIIRGQDNNYMETIRTFSNGSFYMMDIPPGRYTLEVDPAQLGFLNVIQAKVIGFEIKALADGDYIEGLEIILLPEQ